MEGLVSGNYQATEYTDVIVDGENEYVRVYNTSTSALTNGDVYKLVMTKSTYYPTLAAIAQDTVGITQVAVVENSRAGKATIPASDWGWVQVKGECPKVSVSGATTISDVIIPVAAATTMSDASSSTVDGASAAIARTSTTEAGNVQATLLGFRITVA